MRFTKMQGLGNDFVIVDDVEITPELVRSLCDRHFGVGADGVLRVTEGPAMEYWNADGGTAEMCGNGLRCVARYARDRSLVESDTFQVTTPVGKLGATVNDDDVTVELGRAVVGEEITLEGRDWVLVDMGNPHAVTWVEDPESVDVEGEGSRLQENFPEGVNVEFVTVDFPNRIRMRVWERGVGETLACGTGIGAAAVASIRHEGVDDEVAVDVPGGLAQISLDGKAVYLSGPAEYVFEGVFSGEGT